MFLLVDFFYLDLSQGLNDWCNLLTVWFTGVYVVLDLIFLFCCWLRLLLVTISRLMFSFKNKNFVSIVYFANIKDCFTHNNLPPNHKVQVPYNSNLSDCQFFLGKRLSYYSIFLVFARKQKGFFVQNWKIISFLSS